MVVVVVTVAMVVEMTAVIKILVVVSVGMVMVMEETNIFPSVRQSKDGAECHCGVPSSG